MRIGNRGRANKESDIGKEKTMEMEKKPQIGAVAFKDGNYFREVEGKQNVSREDVMTIKTFGFTWEPMHRDTEDPYLQSYFVVEVPDNATAQRVIDRLRQSEAVVAAYVKPPDELP